MQELGIQYLLIVGTLAIAPSVRPRDKLTVIPTQPVGDNVASIESQDDETGGEGQAHRM